MGYLLLFDGWQIAPLFYYSFRLVSISFNVLITNSRGMFSSMAMVWCKCAANSPLLIGFTSGFISIHPPFFIICNLLITFIIISYNCNMSICFYYFSWIIVNFFFVVPRAVVLCLVSCVGSCLVSCVRSWTAAGCDPSPGGCGMYLYVLVNLVSTEKIKKTKNYKNLLTNNRKQHIIVNVNERGC